MYQLREYVTAALILSDVFYYYYDIISLNKRFTAKQILLILPMVFVVLMLFIEQTMFLSAIRHLLI